MRIVGVSVFGTISNNHNFAYLIFHACFYSVVFGGECWVVVGWKLADYCYWMMGEGYFSRVV